MNRPPKLFIAIPVHHRLAIARQCIPTVCAGMDRNDELALFNDGTPDWPVDFYKLGAFVSHRREAAGIEVQRMEHFLFFTKLPPDFTHLYLTDADALHDPDWRRELLGLQNLAGGAPVCGYNTAAHERLVGNTLEDVAGSPIIWRAVAPGISYLLTRAHVERVVRHMTPTWNWDWTVPALLGSRMAIARESVVDHIGAGGLHHDGSAGFDGGDRALNPTPWLILKRAEVVKSLNADPLQTRS